MPNQGRRQFFRGMFTGALGGAAGMIPTPTAAVESERAVIVETTCAFDYGRQELDVGEVFALTGQRNDGVLLSAGYVLLVAPTAHRLSCPCGRLFVDEKKLRAHKKRNHKRPDPLMDDCRRMEGWRKRIES